MISPDWIEALNLSDRRAPDLILSGDKTNNIPYSSIIRKCFHDLNISAIHYVSNVPCIAFLSQDQFDPDEIDQTHKALWNQGVLSLMLVIDNQENTLRAYSLSKIPGLQSDSDKLINVFDLVADALELKNIVLGVESGRFFSENSEKFDPKHRVDHLLLSNLEATVLKLVNQDMDVESAQALIMQIMFVSFLEDKNIINAKYIQSATKNNEVSTLYSLLNMSDLGALKALFDQLKMNFNGDLFIAPCSFDENKNIDVLKKQHIITLLEFRSGRLNLITGQYQIWPYDFKFIPIELISAVYDRFLGFDPIDRKNSGAFYTPMFLARLVVEQSWAELSNLQRSSGKYVDPSCGSGIFLVCTFEKMISEWRKNHPGQLPTWEHLLTLVRRINGFDIKEASIRVSAFSLYIALLENVDPSEISSLIEKGGLLPKLYNKSLVVNDFFNIESDTRKYDLIIGNPPWVSRKNESSKSALAWSKKNKLELPAKEISWGFAWKALQHTNENCIISFLLKATSFISSQNSTTLKARCKWLKEIQVNKIINLADLRFQLFDGGNAPTALFIYKKRYSPFKEYSFDYWVPKTDLSLSNKKAINLSSMDKSKLNIEHVLRDPFLMKKRMWMQSPDAKLFEYISHLRRLNTKLITYQDSKKAKLASNDKWIIGQGYIKAQKHNLEKPGYKPYKSEFVGKLKNLTMREFQPFVLSTQNITPNETNIVHRLGYEGSYKANHVLIPQGVESKQGRLRASFSDVDLTFSSSIQAIHFRDDEVNEAKFLTVLLNSSLVAWFLFHNSSITGMERSKVPQHELLSIPYPSKNNSRNIEESKSAFNQAIELIDELSLSKDDFLKSQTPNILEQIDKIIYRFFNLDKTDISIIEDTINFIVPSIQPAAKAVTPPKLWINTSYNEWESYVNSLTSHLTEKWLKQPMKAIAELVGKSDDLAIVAVKIISGSDQPNYKVNENNNLDGLLSKIWNSLPNKLSGNFQVIPDLKIFIDDVLYLVKPRTKRYWLNTTAYADADSIAIELLNKKTNEIIK